MTTDELREKAGSVGKVAGILRSGLSRGRAKPMQNPGPFLNEEPIFDLSLK